MLNLDYDTLFFKIEQKLSELLQLEYKNALNFGTRGSIQFKLLCKWNLLRAKHVHVDQCSG